MNRPKKCAPPPKPKGETFDVFLKVRFDEDLDRSEEWVKNFLRDVFQFVNSSAYYHVQIEVGFVEGVEV